MEKVLINNSTLTSIADAIRSKTNSIETYKPSEMPAAIHAMSMEGIDFKGLVDGSIKSFHIPYGASDNGVLTLRYQAFAQLTSLESLSFGEGITEIKFYKDNYSTDYDDVPFLGAGYDNKCAIILPSTIKSIGKMVFQDVIYNSLELPEGLEHIGEAAFRSYAYNRVASIGNLIIPSTVKTIDKDAFRNIQVSAVYFKGTPESIEDYALYFAKNYYLDGTSGYPTIYVPWSERKGPAITGTNSTIVYDYTYTE